MNVNNEDKKLAVVVLLLALLLMATRLMAQQYEYRGVYTAQQVFTNLCESCYLELPAEFLQTNLVLSVKTNDEKVLNKAITSAAKGNGWVLSRRGTLWHAEPLQNDGNLVYLSCISNEPVNVPKYLYWYAVKSDSIRCVKRDSLQRLNDSLHLQAVERARIDSLRRDSISRLRLDFKSYRLKYYAYSKSFSDRYGVEWSSLLASGNLRGKLELFDDWRLIASQINDTTFTSRMVEFSVDSSLALDWGSEEQTLKQTFVNDGITTQDYEWRKYGILINVRRDGQRVRMDYVFRDKDNSVSVLQGSVIGLEGDTLRLVGEYSVSRNVQSGVPFLSSIPLLGNLFKVDNAVVDNRAFELYLLPQNKAVEDVKRENKGTIPTTTENGSKEPRNEKERG